jgi:type I restriction enzyme S subunit
MERYSVYKDSGVKWLGDIPSHWEVCKVKHHYKMITGFTPSTGKSEYYSDNSDNTWVTIADMKSKFISESSSHISDLYIKNFKPTIVPKGSLLYSFKLSVGQVAFADKDLYTNEAIASFENNDDVCLDFLFYSASLCIIKNANTNIYGAFILNQELIKNATIVYPPFEEQIAIANYLDSVTSKIDTAIFHQQKMIDLLNERKQIIINNVVTKGLNPNVSMKDSGVDWIGEIPEHWEIKRGKFLFNIINEYSSTGEEELLTVSDRTGITPRSMKNVTMFMAESLVGYKKCKIGDICSNIMWMWHGAVGVTKYDGVISPSYGVYRQRELYYNGDYLDMLLRLPQLVKFYASRSTGLTESRLRLYPDDFMNIYFFVPPMEEQEMIVNRLKSICEPIESAIDAATQQISLLQERKQIIINDVVTGKVKVS